MNKVEQSIMAHIEKLETFNSGGGCYIDLVHLDDGKVIALNNECLCVYSSIDDFWRSMDVTDEVLGKELFF